MLTYSKSTLGVLLTLMHLISGHVTLPLGEFHPHEFFPNQTCIAGRTHVGLCPKFLVFFCFGCTSFWILSDAWSGWCDCKKRLSGPAADDDVLSMISSGHNVLMKVLSSRKHNLQIIKVMWSSGNMKVSCPMWSDLILKLSV